MEMRKQMDHLLKASYNSVLNVRNNCILKTCVGHIQLVDCENEEEILSFAEGP